MAEHLWTVLCEKTLADTQSRVISLIDIIESLSSEGLEKNLEEAHRAGKKGTILNARMQLVSWWYRSDPKEKTLQARFLLHSPSGEKVLGASAKTDWEEHSSTLRLFVNIERVPVSEFGLHWFVVQTPRASKGKTRWVSVARVPMSIDKV